VLLSPGIGLTQSPTNPDQRRGFNELTGRFGFDYKLGFTDDNLLYAFYSKGYKGGGSNPPFRQLGSAASSRSSRRSSSTPSSWGRRTP
jgi:outer membrane receptor protein involved in Fe transport